MVLALPQALTHAQANACLALLTQGLQAHDGPELVVDASALRRFDSAALAVLLEFKRRCLAASKPFVLLGLPKPLADLATLYGIAELLPSVPTPTASPVK
jgi:phospholipid transport system transporter-binding protein